MIVQKIRAKDLSGSDSIATTQEQLQSEAFEEPGTAFEELIFGRWGGQEISVSRAWNEWECGDPWEIADDVDDLARFTSAVRLKATDSAGRAQ